ncbi:hypothetical protein GFS03_04250 [Sulfolobus sp. E5-1-F]|uniref:hypothetical protein n=1 Tax=Saccharolobus sp. E5-1-F TaxID=2663019 RepID=UPI001296B3D3|nr:hypothetical protein [Sulfolobus sp. E5-1-F]QGA53845.1 hypothetical protein GFS03_04250 [Sulfolobus sp. E5-1-F]
MEKLATLGSDKSVTTINAIMAELLTDIKPSQITILRESSPYKDIRDSLRKALSYMGINAEVNDIVIGEGVKTWKDKISEYDFDVLDITPGRKYMALTAANYSKAKEVRYVYLKNEGEGYRIFGYVPFNEIKIFNMRSGDEVKFTALPLTTVVNEKYSELDIESLTALYNILSLHGEVKVKLGNDYMEEREDEFTELCKTRSGMKAFKEEEKIREIIKKDDVYFVADTNVYIQLGNRIKRLFYDKDKGFRLLPAPSVYRELKYKLTSTQKDPNLVKFRLGYLTFKDGHLSAISGLENRIKDASYGDVEFKKEVQRLKGAIANTVYVVTRDQALGISVSSEIKTIVLKTKVDRQKFDMGEFLHCMSFYSVYSSFKESIRRDLFLELDGRNIVKITSVEEENKVNVETLEPKYNYAKVLEILRGAIS